MAEDEQRKAIEAALTSWSEQSRRIDAERDQLVRGAVARGITKHRIYVLTGIARTTIDRIIAKEAEDA